MAKNSKAKQIAQNGRRRLAKLEDKYKQRVARQKAEAKNKRMVDRIAVGAGLAAGGLVSGSISGEIARRDPGYKLNDQGEQVPGYGRMLNYGVGAAGSILAGVANDPLVLAAGVTLGQMVGQQRAIDVFTKGLTKSSQETFKVTITRPNPGE